MRISREARRARAWLPLAGLGVLMALLPIYALTVFDADDVTPLFAVSTDPLHANPYLKPFDNFPEQEIDFAKGSASIGQMTAQIVDVPTDPTDQDTGWMTARLADAGGYSQLNGHRVLATQDIGAGAETVLDGVISNVALMDTFSGYQLELRDIRERERKTKAFTRAETSTILPRGVLNGYGVAFSSFGVNTTLPIPPTQPLTGTYHQNTANVGTVILTGTSAWELAARKLDAEMRAAMDSIEPVEGSPEAYAFNLFRVLWRDKAAGGAYTELNQIAQRHSGLPSGYLTRFYHLGASVDVVSSVVLNNLVSGDTLPSDQQQIELIVQYVGPPTEAWPLHIQGETVGSLAADLYDGVHSDEDPRIAYSAAALAALTTPVRMILKKPADDLREWTEKNLYPINFAAPVLNAAGEIAPITYLLPDSSVTPTSLVNANCAPAGGGWSHGAQDAVNVVKVAYKRDFRGPNGAVLEREIEIEHRIQDSIDLLGEQELTISSEALRALGNSQGAPLVGDVTDEVGSQVAAQITRMVTDRFALGGQYFRLRGMRTDADVEALQPGSWCTVGVSWMPDYLSGERGLSRLAQVVSRRNVNAAWCELTLIDAGSANAPLGQPTLGTVTVDAAGVLSIPVTALAAGDPEARVDYAVSPTEPLPGSSLWTFAGRVDSVPSTVTTPAVPPGETAWVRARSEGVGLRPSTYTTAVSVVASAAARILTAELAFDAVGLASVTWTPNPDCLGVRIYYDVHSPTTVPSFSTFVDVDASDLQYDFTGVTVLTGQALSVRLEPYTGWTGAAVSGTAGVAVGLIEVRHETTIKSGGIEINPQTERILVGAATAPLTGVGIFIGRDGADYEFRAGDPAGDYVHWDGSSLTVSGTISATAGSIGGWSIAAGELSAGAVKLQSTAERILLGAATAPLAGLGIFIGKDGSDYELRAGDPLGSHIHWDGAALHLQGAIIQSPASSSDLTLQGWTHNLPFSASDFDTVSWSSGTIVFPYGGTFNITAGNTGNMAAVTFVYLDTAVSTTALQTTGVHTDAVGANKVLVAVCAPNGDPSKNAEFQVFGGGFGIGVSKTIFANVIAANTITGNEIVTNTLNATHVSSLSFAGKTAVFDFGSVGGWTMAGGSLSAGSVTIESSAERIRMGLATAPLTGKGVFLGKDGTDYEFRAGDPAGDYIHFDGSTFEIKTNSFTGSNPVFSGSVKIRAGTGVDLLELRASSSDGQLVVRNASADAVFVVTGASGSAQITGSHDLTISPNGYLYLGNNPGDLRYGNSGTWGPAHVSGAANTVTGTLTETTLRTITTPTGGLGSTAKHDALRFEAYGRLTGTGGSKTIRVKYAGATIATIVLASSTVLDWWITGYVIGTTQTTQRIVVHFRTEGGSGALHQIDYGTGSVDYSSTAGNVTITGQLGNAADSIVVEASAGEFLTHV